MSTVRARDVVGRRIVNVRRSRLYDPSIAQTVWVIDALELDDGALLVFHPSDTGDDLYVTMGRRTPGGG